MRPWLSAALGLVLIGGTWPAHATTDATTCRAASADTGTAPATDILCFALDVDCTKAVGVLRLRSTDTTTYPTTIPGAQWTLGFEVDHVRHEFVLTRSVTGADSANMHVAGADDQIPDVRVSATTITWSIPRAASAALQAGGLITELTATAKNALGQGWERTAKDSTSDPRRTASCE